MDYLAVYHYCRSVMIAKPFVSGCDNLSMIFEKNMRTFVSLRDDSPETKVDGQEDLRKKQSLAVRAHSFFIRFIRLHGDLFKWTLATSRGITDLQKSPGSGGAVEQAEPYVAERFDVNKCMSLIHKVLSDFEFFMRYDESSVFSEMLLVKLLAIALFSVHHTASIFGERAPSDPLDNSITESLALYFLFNFISRCVN
jgi:Est1 DNA/RNA binding domain